VYALQGLYDTEAALAKIRALTAHDNGNSLTNLLWWLHSRGPAAASSGTGTGSGSPLAAAGTATDSDSGGQHE
jgi:endo-1,3(4)-beta-glucanase